MTSNTIDFWYEFASPYSYLAATRVNELAEGQGVAVRWRPFLLGAIFKMHKLKVRPMELLPVKTRYMWMDAERKAKRYGVPIKLPSRFPRAAVLPARVALLGIGEGWGEEFSRRVYHANFAEDEEIGESAVVAEILKTMGLDAEDVIARATTDDNKQALRDQTDEAFRLGIFGVPTFIAGGEMFWGDDRLEMALEKAAG